VGIPAGTIADGVLGENGLLEVDVARPEPRIHHHDVQEAAAAHLWIRDLRLDSGQCSAQRAPCHHFISEEASGRLRFLRGYGSIQVAHVVGPVSLAAEVAGRAGVPVAPRPARLDTVATRSRGSAGLARCAWNPAMKARMRSSGRARPVSATADTRCSRGTWRSCS